MKFLEFANIMSAPRINRYLYASGNNSRKAMTLYRKNLKLSQEMFTVINCFEVALRNAIDKQCVANLGNDWLRDAAAIGGVFDNRYCNLTKQNINSAISNLHAYNHHKLVAELGFGFWRYMYAPRQYIATGRNLLQAFPAKPSSSALMQYNHVYVFNELAYINDLRNRIAHHEPICFLPTTNIIDTNYAREHYSKICQFFQWMQIDEVSLLYGLDHIEKVCDEIDALK